MTRASADAAVDPARSISVVRRLGYRILPGDAFSYILHLRPREWPIMAAHTALGFLLATGWPVTGSGASWVDAAWGIGLWVVALNGGTLALNSAFDDDEGDIGYLDAPPAPPRHLAVFGTALMAIGAWFAIGISTLYAVTYGACFIMSILYSVPPVRLKAVAGADWVINMVGFGALTPLAGWAASGRPLEPWSGLLFLGFAPLFAALYPLTQLYQFDEDAARGDRTLALVLGMRRSLQVAIGAAIIAFAMFAAAILSGPANRLWPAIVVAAFAWFLVLVLWYRRHPTMRPADHQRGMYAALRAWGMTDIVLLMIFL